MGKPALALSSELARAAGGLLRWEQRDHANASSGSLPTRKRLESKPGIMAAHLSTATALRNALEIGPGIRLRKYTTKQGRR
jgi:hypothetical protein